MIDPVDQQEEEEGESDEDDRIAVSHAIVS
jgi:hypothetical protein